MTKTGTRLEAADTRAAAIQGAAALALLNAEADAWQVPELNGDYLTAIDYVNARLDRWKASPQTLKAKIEAAAHAYKWRSRLAAISSSLVIATGGVLGATSKVLAKLGGDDQKSVVVMAVAGIGTSYVLNALLKPKFVMKHGERAKRWKQLLDELRRALEKAREHDGNSDG